MDLVGKFQHPINTNVVLQLAVLNAHPYFVVGGDNGFARLFDRKSGLEIARLDHQSEHCRSMFVQWLVPSANKGTLIQAVAVSVPVLR